MGTTQWKQEEVGEGSNVMSLKMRTLQQILLEWSNQKREMGLPYDGTHGKGENAYDNSVGEPHVYEGNSGRLF